MDDILLDLKENEEKQVAKVEEKDDTKSKKMTKKITIRVSDSTYEKLENQAAQLEKSKSELLRESYENAKIIDTKFIESFHTELQKQGINLNQIARSLNRYNSIEVQKIIQVLEHVEKVNSKAIHVMEELKREVS